MELLSYIFDFILHVDVHLGEIISQYGVVAYVIVFIILFAETGLVFTPFLPGDSLLFAVGAFASVGAFNIAILLPLFWFAVFFGDSVNYWSGHFLGEKILTNKIIPINKAYLHRTQVFYEKHGGMTIFWARFIPIVRTFAPFVAGVGKMQYTRFMYFNAVGGAVWVFCFILLGYFFGTIPVVKENFSLVIFFIIVLSFVPLLIEYGRKKIQNKAHA